MKAVIISIKAMWCDLIFRYSKTLEIRKSFPVNIEPPFKVYCYCTKDRNGWFRMSDMTRLDGSVVGEFTCTGHISFGVPYPAYQHELDEDILFRACTSYYPLHRYAQHDLIHGWEIENAELYKKPLPLSEFGIKRPPQSWQYVGAIP